MTLGHGATGSVLPVLYPLLPVPVFAAAPLVFAAVVDRPGMLGVVPGARLSSSAGERTARIEGSAGDALGAGSHSKRDKSA